MEPARTTASGPPARIARGRSGGFGRTTSGAAEAVSDDLRRGGGEWLARRRRVAALSLGAMASLGVVAAYQTGLVRRPPEPRVPPLDAERVDAAGEAYQFLKTPDAALGLASYAVTLALAGMGGGRAGVRGTQAGRAHTRPWVPLVLAAKVLADAAGGVLLTAEQATRHRRFCSWCLVASMASVAMVPQVVPEARGAWRRLVRG